MAAASLPLKTRSRSPPSPAPPLPLSPSTSQQAASRCHAQPASAALYHDMQVEIVRFSTDNDSIGEVLCKRAQALNACAVVMASHNKVRCLWVSD